MWQAPAFVQSTDECSPWRKTGCGRDTLTSVPFGGQLTVASLTLESQRQLCEVKRPPNLVRTLDL